MTKPKKTAKTRKIKSASKSKVPIGFTVPVFDPTGKQTGNIPVSKEIFGLKEDPKLLALYVRVFRANQRQGTASTKTRGEVVGSTRKIYRQKGTGRARHGDIKAPIFVGGGVVGGPKPRDYSLKMNKKLIKKSLFTALSLKIKTGDIFVLSKDFSKIEPKTKIFFNFLKNINLNGKKALLVLESLTSKNLILAARNLPGVKLSSAKSINAFAVLNSNKILFSEEVLPTLESHYLTASKSEKKHEN